MTSPKDFLLTTGQVAAFFGTSTETIRDWIAEGKIKGVKSGHRYKVWNSEMMRYAQKEYGYEGEAPY